MVSIQTFRFGLLGCVQDSVDGPSFGGQFEGKYGFWLSRSVMNDIRNSESGFGETGGC